MKDKRDLLTIEYVNHLSIYDVTRMEQDKEKEYTHFYTKDNGKERIVAIIKNENITAIKNGYGAEFLEAWLMNKKGGIKV